MLVRNWNFMSRSTLTNILLLNKELKSVVINHGNFFSNESKPLSKIM